VKNHHEASGGLGGKEDGNSGKFSAPSPAGSGAPVPEFDSLYGLFITVWESNSGKFEAAAKNQGSLQFFCVLSILGNFGISLFSARGGLTNLAPSDYTIFSRSGTQESKPFDGLVRCWCSHPLPFSTPVAVKASLTISDAPHTSLVQRGNWG